MKIHKKNVSVIIETSNGERYRGKVNLDSENEPMDRLSDLFVKGKNPFITMYGVSAHGGNKVIIINKAHIVSVMPDGDGSVEDEAKLLMEKEDAETKKT